MRTPFLAAALAILAALPAFGQEEEGISPSLETLYRKVAERLQKSVVSVHVSRRADRPTRRSGWRLPMMDGGVFRNRPQDAPTSGTLLGPDGTILTTYFNVAGTVDSIDVRLWDGRVLPAVLKGYNATYDIALLKVDAKDLPTLTKAPLRDLRTGRIVVALGRAPDRKNLTLNPGIISAPWRMSGRGLQIDSLMNYGNVGGPVVDRQGRWIGVTCKVDTKFSGSYGQNSGIGFAVTWDRLEKILPDLRLGKNVGESRNAFMGIQANVEAEVEGVEISEVIPSSAAEKAGIKPGDVITSFDGKKVKNFDMLRAAILGKSPRDKVTVILLRGKETLTFQVVLGYRPGE